MYFAAVLCCLLISYCVGDSHTATIRKEMKQPTKELCMECKGCLTRIGAQTWCISTEDASRCMSLERPSLWCGDSMPARCMTQDLDACEGCLTNYLGVNTCSELGYRECLNRGQQWCGRFNGGVVKLDRMEPRGPVSDVKVEDPKYTLSLRDIFVNPRYNIKVDDSVFSKVRVQMPKKNLKGVQREMGNILIVGTTIDDLVGQVNVDSDDSSDVLGMDQDSSEPQQASGDEPKITGDEPRASGDEPKASGDEPKIAGDKQQVQDMDDWQKKKGGKPAQPYDSPDMKSTTDQVGGGKSEPKDC